MVPVDGVAAYKKPRAEALVGRAWSARIALCMGWRRMAGVGGGPLCGVGQARGCADRYAGSIHGTLFH